MQCRHRIYHSLAMFAPCFLLLACIVLTCNAAIVKDCHSTLKSDVVFVLDSSGSIGASTFEHYVKGFISDFIGRVTISSERVRIGVYVYSKMCIRAIGLSEYNSRDRLLIAVGAKIPYLGGMTATGSALHKVAQDGFPKRLDGATKLVIVITDGRANEGMKVSTAAAELKSLVDRVIVVGVGKMVNQEELSVIATSAKDVYNIDSYSALVHDVVDITAWACPNPCDKEAREITVIQEDIRRIEMNHMTFVQGSNQKIGSLEALVSFHKSERVKLEMQDKELLEELRSLEMQNKVLVTASKNKSVESLTLEIKELRLQVSSLEVENRKLTTELSTYTNRISTTRAEIETSQTQVEELKLTYLQLQKSVESLNKISAEIVSNIQTIEHSITKLEQEKARLVEMNRNSLTTNSLEYETKIKETTTEISFTRSKITNIKQDINSLRIRVVNLRSEKATVDKEHALLKVENSKMLRTVTLLNTKVKHLQLEITKEHELIDTFRYKLKANTGRSGEITELQRTLSRLQTEFSSISVTVTSIAEEIRTGKVNIETISTKVYQVQSRIRVLETRIIGLREQISIRTISLQTHETRKMSMRNRLTMCHHAVQSQGGQLALMLKANSGVSLADLLENMPTTTSFFDISKSYYKSSLIQGWSKSAYKWAKIVLLTKGIAVVELTFDTRHTNLNTFMSQINLIRSFPWNAASLQSQCCAEGPHDLTVGNWTLVKTTTSCGIHGYFKVYDVRDKCSFDLNGSTGPWFVYTTDYLSNPSSKFQYADEMRLYVANYHESYTITEAESLVFSYQSGYSADVFSLLTGSLCSPPQVYSSANSSHAWYKSESLKYFPRGKFSRITMRLYKYDKVVAEAVFDSSSSDMSSWFSAKNVISAKHWTVSDLQRQTFTLEGQKGERYDSRMIIGGTSNRCNALFMAVGPSDECGRQTNGYHLYYSRDQGYEMKQADYLKLFAY